MVPVVVHCGEGGNFEENENKKEKCVMKTPKWMRSGEMGSALKKSVKTRTEQHQRRKRIERELGEVRGCFCFFRELKKRQSCSVQTQ